MDFDDRAIITDDEELEEWEHERRRWLPNVMLWLLLGLAVLGVLLPRILSLPAVRDRWLAILMKNSTGHAGS